MPAVVAQDVAEGFISAAAARKLYGVVVRGNMSLDESATLAAAKAARIGLQGQAAVQSEKQKPPNKPTSAPRGEDDDIRKGLRPALLALAAVTGLTLACGSGRGRNQIAGRQGPAATQFAFVPADIGVRSRHFQEARPRSSKSVHSAATPDDAGA